MHEIDQKLLFEKLDLFSQFPGGSLDEYKYFYSSLKPILPVIHELLVVQSNELKEIRRSARAAEASALEYRTRAESQEKMNQKLAEDLRTTRAEADKAASESKTTSEKQAAALAALSQEFQDQREKAIDERNRLNERLSRELVAKQEAWDKERARMNELAAERALRIKSFVQQVSDQMAQLQNLLTWGTETIK